MEEKITLANSFVMMDEQQREDLVDKVADLAGRRVDFTRHKPPLGAWNCSFFNPYDLEG